MVNSRGSSWCAIRQCRDTNLINIVLSFCSAIGFDYLDCGSIGGCISNCEGFFCYVGDCGVQDCFAVFVAEMADDGFNVVLVCVAGFRGGGRIAGGAGWGVGWCDRWSGRNCCCGSRRWRLFSWIVGFGDQVLYCENLWLTRLTGGIKKECFRVGCYLAVWSIESAVR